MKAIAADPTYGPRLLKAVPAILDQVFKLVEMPMPQGNPELSLQFFNQLRIGSIAFINLLFTQFERKVKLL